MATTTTTTTTPKYPGIIELGYNDGSVLGLLKTRLNELGYGPLTPAIPNYGLQTMEAVRRFQKDNHLLQDGKVMELTWERLFNPVKADIPLNSLQREAIKIAKTQLYVREKTNHNDGIEVEMYQKATGNHKGDSWCMSGLYWVFLQACTLLKRLCPVPKTGGVLECLRLAKLVKDGTVEIIYNDPQPGDQGIMDFGGGKGHTFIVTERKGNRVFTIEGNTSADPSYAGEDREGNGWFERNRSISSTKCFLRYK